MQEYAAMNPTCTDYFISEGNIVFKCPTCQSAVFASIPQIDPIIGVNVVCTACGNISHVAGGYRTWPKLPDSKITGGVQVPISRYVDWFFSHPLVASLKKENQLDILYDYGLWGFCPGCHYQYASTVLAYTFPVLQMSSPSAGLVLNTSKPNSARDTIALHEGHCPSCKSAYLIIIIADIPKYVRVEIANKKKKEPR